MNISAKTIFEFHVIRTQCHINCMNYFAELLGYHFPEHDNDKNHDPVRIGYAYMNYARYHHRCKMLPVYIDAFNYAHAEHHRTQPHHIEHYDSVSDIPDIRLIEMVCDWFSANFEQTHILHEKNVGNVYKFYKKFCKSSKWTRHQRKIIETTIKQIETLANYNFVLKIWQPVIELSDL